MFPAEEGPEHTVEKWKHSLQYLRIETSSPKRGCFQNDLHSCFEPAINVYQKQSYYPFNKYVESEKFFFVSLLSKRDVT